jgi:hypothetical protein
MSTEIATINAKKNFSYYYADPVYRKKHLEYCYQKVVCPDCGESYSRNNKTYHLKSKKHLNPTVDSKLVLENRIKELEKELELQKLSNAQGK